MAAVTSTIVALGGLGLSAAQAVKANKDKKEADRAASVARNQLESIKAENKYKALQVPDVSKLAFERNASNQAAMVSALKEMGPEGAAQAARIEQASRESNLSAAEKQAQAEFSRDKIVAEQEQLIEDDRVLAERGLAWSDLQGAQTASEDALNRRNRAIKSAVGSLGDVATGIGQATSLEAQAQRNKKRASESVAATGAATGAASAAAKSAASEDLFGNLDWGFLEGIQSNLSNLNIQ